MTHSGRRDQDIRRARCEPAALGDIRKLSRQPRNRQIDRQNPSPVQMNEGIEPFRQVGSLARRSLPGRFSITAGLYRFGYDASSGSGERVVDVVVARVTRR